MNESEIPMSEQHAARHSNAHQELVRRALTRRAFITRAAAVTGVAISAPILAACGSSNETSTPSTPGTASASGVASSTSAAAVTAATSPVSTVAGESATPKIVAAANTFLATLDDTQKTTLLLSYPTSDAVATTADFSGRVGEQFGTSVWSNYPISDVIRQGLRLGDLSDDQRNAAMAVLQVALSADGYTKVTNIMDADQVLSDSGTNYACGKDNYVVTLVGAPSETDQWMLQFGGHHLGLNVTIEGDQQTMAPTLTGCQPSSFTDAADKVLPLGVETDAAFQLANMLDDTQLNQAVLTPAVTDLVLGPGKDGQALDPVGIPASSLTADQQAVLLQLIGAWVNILNDPAAAAEMATIRQNLSDTYFAWSGEIADGSSVYFRVTGPTVIIEYADQGSMGGGPGGGGPGAGATGAGPGAITPAAGAPADATADATASGDTTAGTGTADSASVQAGGANHIHTVYRNPTNDYGRGFA